MTRVDYFHDPHAPQANSITVAVSAFVREDTGLLLMIRRTDNDLYSIPGGQLEFGETLTQTAIREVKEETGLDIEVTGLIGIYSNPAHVIEYDDGEIRQEFSICFRADPTGGELRESDESTEVLWVDPTELDSLNIHPSTRLRISHGIENRPDPFYT
jgi:ADP-ribose pyrophosphatase YjhB (NUDIX family)